MSAMKRMSQGFTIVETSIVLGIIGVMTATIFLAVPALQRNSHDTALKNKVDRIKTEIDTYGVNNQGQYPFNSSCGNNPGDWCDFYSRYITAGSVDDNMPGTTNQSIFSGGSAYAPQHCGSDNLGGPCGSSVIPTTYASAQLVYSAKCSTSGVLVNAGGPVSTSTKNYAIIIRLEKADTYFCVDNT